MKKVPVQQVIRRIQTENLWWTQPGLVKQPFSDMRRRAYFDLLYPLVTKLDVRRAVLLMGPRRVGKTVLLHHVIQQLIADGISPNQLCYLSVDHPLYNDCGLNDLLEMSIEAAGRSKDASPVYMFFDEIQYLREWEIHLKTLVDSHPDVRFVASGSAAAALKLKSTESGAGRFTDFLLPPLTFYEYLELLDKTSLVQHPDPAVEEPVRFFRTDDIRALNESFVHYLNFGGYPEVVLSPTIQDNLGRFIKSDIIDKVLLRDLPSLYGIQDIQELNSLFTAIAFNTAGEVSLEALSRSSGVAKNTIKRYIEYLEAAFLIKTVHRIDREGRKFQRANFFKVYLTNPSIRSALFSPLPEDDESFGDLVETGVFSQWFHAEDQFRIRYARWSGGEVDIAFLDAELQPMWAVEVKWTDRYVARPAELEGLISFCRRHGFERVAVTSKSLFRSVNVNELRLDFIPASLYCYTVGYNLIKGRIGTRGSLMGQRERHRDPVATK